MPTKMKPAKTTGSAYKVSVGDRFRSVIADAYALWEVKKARGRGAWECEVVEEKVFGGEEILRAVAFEQMFDRMASDNDRFYANLRPGQVVHYDNGFECYVRCKVVPVNGCNVLRPVALVGKWRQHDLWTRYRNGSVRMGYYPDKIEKGETMTPNVFSIYEHTKRGADPTALPAVDYAPPELSPEEAARAEDWRAVEAVQVLLNQTDKDPKALLKMAGDLISSYWGHA